MSDTDFFERSHKQSKLNTLILSALTGLIILFIGLLKWIGSDIISDVRDTQRTMVDVRLSIGSIQADVIGLKLKILEMATKSDLTSRDIKIDELEREITRLNRQASHETR